jgi:hypothetical protein
MDSVIAKNMWKTKKKDLKQVTTDDGRWYEDKDGKRHYSVTTILKYGQDEPYYLKRWKEETTDADKCEGCDAGTVMHWFCEEYYREGYKQLVKEDFDGYDQLNIVKGNFPDEVELSRKERGKSRTYYTKPKDKYINHIVNLGWQRYKQYNKHFFKTNYIVPYLIEEQLSWTDGKYSFAGTVDYIADVAPTADDICILCIGDHKSAKDFNNYDTKISNYTLQLAAYRKAVETTYKKKINKGLIGTATTKSFRLHEIDGDELDSAWEDFYDLLKNFTDDMEKGGK